MKTYFVAIELDDEDPASPQDIFYRISRALRSTSVFVYPTASNLAADYVDYRAAHIDAINGLQEEAEVGIFHGTDDVPTVGFKMVENLEKGVNYDK